MKFNILQAILVTIVLVCSCAKGDNTPQSMPVVSHTLLGMVVGSDGNALSGVSVTIYYDNEEIGRLKTDSRGMYSLDIVDLGVYRISAHKDGYTYGGTVADADQDAVTASQIVLSLLAMIPERTASEVDAAKVSENGAILRTSRQVNVSAGGGTPVKREQQVEVSIPPGTGIMIDGEPLTGAAELAVAPVGVDAVPPSPVGIQPVGAVMLEPAGASFTNEVRVTLPVDIQLPPGVELPLYRFNGSEWRVAGTATVDETGLGAETGITEFGMVAVAPDVTIASQAGDMSQEVTKTEPVSSSQTSVQVEVESSLDFPSGLPANMSEEFARSLIMNRTGLVFDKPQKVTVQLGALQKVVRDDVVLAVAKPEPWTQECVVEILARIEETVLVLDMETGTFTQSYTITYRISSGRARTRCLRRWIEHNQGSI